jgi:putative methionine-R-sulfoxide reductase with GAF domain
MNVLKVDDVGELESTVQLLARWRESLLKLVLRIAVVVGLPLIVITAVTDFNQGLYYRLIINPLAYLFAAYAAFAPMSYRRRSAIFLFMIVGVATTDLFLDGLRGDARLLFIFFSVMSMALLGMRAGWISLGISLLIPTLFGIGRDLGWFNLENPAMELEPVHYIAFMLLQGVLSGIMMAWNNIFERFVGESRERETLVRDEMKRYQARLESQVAERAKALQASFQVSQRLASISDVEELTHAVVTEVQRAFNFYHAHIYLYDERKENLVMVGGTGEAGTALLARKHAIPSGRGLVGQAAETNKPVLVGDTQANPNWLPNPLLPDTRSEAAVPIAVGDQVLGVLDVQQNTVNGLTEPDVELLLSIANQVGVGVQHANQFTEIKRKADRESKATQITHKIQTVGTVEDVLETAVRELGTVLGADQARIHLSVRSNKS